jgi:hypothetical protein
MILNVFVAPENLQILKDTLIPPILLAQTVIAPTLIQTIRIAIENVPHLACQLLLGKRLL